MAATPSYDARKPSLGRVRPGASALQSERSPHTPLSRSVSGLYGSPGSSFRVDEDNLIVFDIGSRYTRAGFAGEPTPRCSIRHDPNLWRRVGDYRSVDPAYNHTIRKRRRSSSWGEEYELWRPQLRDLVNDRDLDLGLVEDKLDRLIRECENKYLMLDSRTKRVALVVPSTLPRPLLSLILRRLFEGLQTPTVTLLPSSAMVAVAAGLRSALVVEVGWHETHVTSIYEYREVSQKRSVRAGKMLSENFAQVIKEELGTAEGPEKGSNSLNFEQIEEIITRVGWCRARGTSSDDDRTVSIPISTSDGSINLDVPFLRLAEPADTALFASKTDPSLIDDEDLPLHQLVYNSLLQLPVDIRRVCMSRILFTGGTSNLPGLKSRVLQELEELIQERGWDPVRSYGSAKKSLRKPVVLGERNSNIQASPLQDTIKQTDLSRVTSDTSSTEDTTPSLPASLQPQEKDPIVEKLSRMSIKDTPPPAVDGKIRALNTLGAWAGASLMVNLRVKGAVEIDKERFLQYGLVGGAGKKDQSDAKVRQSLGPGAAGRGAAGERKSWGLGVWS